MKKLKKKIISMILVVAILFSSIQVSVTLSDIIKAATSKATASGGLEITKLDVVEDSESSEHSLGAHIEWNGTKDYCYRIHQKEKENGDWVEVGIDYKRINRLDVLLIHPGDFKHYQSWMMDSGYGVHPITGKQLIYVESVNIEDFNLDPSKYLTKNGKKDNGWNYDVIVYGFSNGNRVHETDVDNGVDITTEGANLTIEYAKNGGGVLFGHDTIGGPNIDHPGFQLCAGLLNMPIDNAEWRNELPTIDENHFITDKIQVVKKGLLTQYPYKIKEHLTIPESHTLLQPLYNANTWVQFEEDPDVPLKFYDESTLNYLTTNGNIAMIQTGNANGQATQEEQQLLANVTFYLNQFLFNKSASDDYSAKDMAAPSKPTYEITDVNYGDYIGYDVQLSAVDNGTTYQYYVEGYNKDNVLEEATQRTETEEVTVTSGISHFKYYLSKDSYATVDRTKYTETSYDGYLKDTDCKDFYPNDNTYIHVYAVDKEGNEGEPESIKLEFAQYKYFIQYYDETIEEKGVFDMVKEESNYAYIYMNVYYNNPSPKDGFEIPEGVTIKMNMDISKNIMKIYYIRKEYDCIVNHYKEDSNGEFQLADTDTYRKRFEEEFEVPTRTYDKYITPETQTITISHKEDENVVNYYYSRNKCNINYDYETNGGKPLDSNQSQVETVSPGDNIDLTPEGIKTLDSGSYSPSNPDGWQFVGWHTDKDAKTGLDTLKVGDTDENITLYAIYKKDVTVKYVETGSQANIGYGPIEVQKQVFTLYNNDTAAEFRTQSNASRDNYYKGLKWVIDGWNRSDKYTDNIEDMRMSKIPLDTIASTKEDVTFYAFYYAPMVVTYQYLKPLGVYTTQYHQLVYSSAKDKDNILYPTVTAPELEENQYPANEVGATEWEFIGWSPSKTANSSDEIFGPGEQIVETENSVYYAIYERDITITYCSEDGKRTTQQVHQKRNTGNTKPETESIKLPTINDFGEYTATGWATGPDDTNPEYDEQSTVTFDKPTTVYATYKKDLTITYVDYDGDKPHTSTVSKEQGANSSDIEGTKEELNFNIGSIFPAIDENGDILTPTCWTTDTTSDNYKPISQNSYVKVKDDMKLYAIYQKDVQAHFKSIRGTLVTTDTLTGTTVFNSYDLSQSTTTGLTAPNLSFCSVDYLTWTAAGWSSGTTASSPIDLLQGAKFSITKDTTYYGIYSSSKLVSFIDYNSGAKRTRTLTTGDTLTAYNKSYANTMATSPVIGEYGSGWDILGWSNSSQSNNITMGSGAQFGFSGASIYYAVYEKNINIKLVSLTPSETKTVTQNKVINMGTGTATSSEFAFPNITDVNINGTTYRGFEWADVPEATGGNSYPLNSIGDFNDTITLYARYNATIKTEYNTNGGTKIEPTEINKVVSGTGEESVEKTTIPTELPQKSGYTFAGYWESDGEKLYPGQEYTISDSSIVNAMYKIDTIDKKLYINWNDAVNKLNTRPENVVLKVYRDGVLVTEYLVSKLNASVVYPTVNEVIDARGKILTLDKSKTQDTFTFAGLQKTNPETGLDYQYTLTVNDVTTSLDSVEYEKTISADTWTINYALENTRNKEITGNVYWDDYENMWNTRPEFINIILLREDPTTGVVVVETKNIATTGNNTTAFTFDNLLELNDSGEPYKYTVFSSYIQSYSTTETGTDIFAKLDGRPNSQLNGKGNNLSLMLNSYSEPGKPTTKDDYDITLSNHEDSVVVGFKEVKKIWVGEGAESEETYDINKYTGNTYDVLVSLKEPTKIIRIPDGKYEVKLYNSQLYELLNFSSLANEQTNVELEEINGKYYITFSSKYSHSEFKHLHAQIVLNNWIGYYSTKNKITSNVNYWTGPLEE